MCTESIKRRVSGRSEWYRDKAKIGESLLKITVNGRRRMKEYHRIRHINFILKFHRESRRFSNTERFAKRDIEDSPTVLNHVIAFDYLSEFDFCNSVSSLNINWERFG